MRLLQNFIGVKPRSLSRKPDGPDTLGAVRTKKTLRSPNNRRENMESVQPKPGPAWA